VKNNGGEDEAMESKYQRAVLAQERIGWYERREIVTSDVGVGSGALNAVEC